MNASQRQLEVFVEIYRSRNISRAAERLGITQSAASLHLKQLEALFGVRLFDRTTRNLFPTSAAERAIATAERILSASSGLTQDMKRLTMLSGGRLAVVASAGFASTFLPSLLARFSEQNPKIEIALYDAPASQIVDKLLASDAELAFGSVEGSIPDVSITPLLRGRMCAVGVSKGSIAGRRNIRWDELTSLKTITMGRNTRMRAIIDAALEQSDQNFVPTLEVSLYITALSLSAEGFGVSVLPDYIVPKRQFPSLVCVPLVRPAVNLQVSIVRKAGRSLSPASSKFLAMVRADFSQKASGG